MSELKDAIDRMREVLREQGWCKYLLVDSEGHVCFTGAAWLAAGAEVHADDPWPEQRINIKTADGMLWEKLMALATRIIGGWPSNWNDKPDRNQTDVKRLLDEMESFLMDNPGWERDPTPY